VSAAVEIDDATDPRLADYVALTDAELRRRVETGLFIVEGELAIRRLLESRYPVRSLLVTPAMHARLAPAVEGLQAPVYVAQRDVMAAVAGFDIHRGAVASATRLPLPEPGALTATGDRLALLEGINDHENLGALFRNAAAFGVGGVLLSPNCADPLYRRSVRVSLGHVLHVPFTVLSPWPDGIRELARTGWSTVALTPSDDSEPVTVLDGAAGRVAIAVGAEGPGLTDAALEACDRRVHIPMAAGVDSVNVATAAAIAFHCLTRS
jgi:tRNA G18 (ribose-2'-O)-methylase SpoU